MLFLELFIVFCAFTPDIILKPVKWNIPAFRRISKYIFTFISFRAENNKKQNTQRTNFNKNVVYFTEKYRRRSFK